MAQQTAVSWLIEQLRQLAHNPKTHLGMGDVRVTQGYLDDIEEQAKAMDKKQKIDAVIYGLDEDGHTGDWKISVAENYYKKTYTEM